MVGAQKDGGSGNGAPAPTGGSGTQHLQVTPQNVVELAVTFRQNAAVYRPLLQNAEFDLTIKKPWLGDPFSQWAKDEFDNYFVKNENSLVATLRRMHKLHMDTYEALEKIADQYGKTEELNQQLLRQQEQTP